MKKYKTVEKYLGYINKADVTNVASGYLVYPSQNMIVNDGEKIVARKGFSLYGASNSALTPIKSSYTWNTSTGTEIPLRSYQGELEYYYSSAWRRLANGFGSSVNFNFAEWWDNTEKIDELLFVNGDSNMRMWSGAITTIASVGTNTLTMQTSTYATWAEARFLTSGTRTVIIGGVTYTYTGGESTDTLTGVTPDPALASPAIAAGDIVHQGIRTTANTPASGFNSSLIGMLNNQIYVGDLKKRTIYVSKNTSYTDYSSSSPRVPGDGLTGGITIDSPPIAIIPQEEAMYFSGAKDQWYQTKFVLSSDNTKESLTIIRLKTASQSGARSQGGTINIPNDVLYISNENTVETLGRVQNLPTVQSLPLSDPVKLDFDNFTYTISPHIKIYKKKVWITIPSSSTVMIYDLIRQYWNPPQVMSISRLEIIGGRLYGHSSLVPETYLLEDGYNDNDNPIECIAAFAYRNFGTRSNFKSQDEYYTEGYISSSTTITLQILQEYGGGKGVTEYEINGADDSILFTASSDSSLGKNSLGSNPFGSTVVTQTDLSKFRVVHDITKRGNDYYEYQAIYRTNDVDKQWEILAHGPNARISTQQNVGIRQ